MEVEDAYRGQIRDPTTRGPISTQQNQLVYRPHSGQGGTAWRRLCVEFLKFEFEEQGVMPTSVGMGLLGDLIDRPTTKIIPIRGRAMPSSLTTSIFP